MAGAGGSRDINRYESLRTSSALLAGMAPVVRYGLIAAGLALGYSQVADLVSDMQLTWAERRIVGAVAIVTLGGFTLGAWVAGRLLRALADLMNLMVDQAEAVDRSADLIEWHVVPLLSRMAEAIEKGVQQPRDDGRALAVAGARQAMADRRWDLADRLVQSFVRDYGGTREADTLANELAEAREVVVADLRARLEAAQSANDADLVIDYRDELTLHLHGEPLKQLDRGVIKWLMGRVQRRLRNGNVGPEVARLAERIADSFGDTMEGASMRSALPTLRRSAGLCPRCARPYRGIENACPLCLAEAMPRVISAPAEPEEASP